jgi:hypothetical protein
VTETANTSPVIGVVSFGSSGPNRRWWLTRLPLSAVFSCVIFFGLRPEPFGLTPNGLDPFFYTGYAINFHELIREIGGRYYFVSRWSSYYPNYLLTKLLGDTAGRLAWRYLLSIAILLSIWHLGRRWKWSLHLELLVGLTVLTMPMFARAFLTDYVEYSVVAYGLLLAVQCLESEHTNFRSMAIGVLCGTILVANPIAATVCFAPVVG